MKVRYLSMAVEKSYEKNVCALHIGTRTYLFNHLAPFNLFLGRPKPQTPSLASPAHQQHQVKGTPKLWLERFGTGCPYSHGRDLGLDAHIHVLQPEINPPI